MAEPMSASTFLAALIAEGVRVVEEGDWRSHNRNHKGPWGPVNGVIIHHTVTEGTSNTVRIVRDGYEDLPGPLCHGMIAKDGRVHLVGYGRTNHAGGGDPVTLQHVINEDYGDRLLQPTKGNKDGVDGNSHFYGFECENLGNGKDPWPAAQLDAIERVSAAICRYHGWGKHSTIGHKEWSSDKVDPRGPSMIDIRDRIGDRLDHAANWNSTEEDDMTPEQDARLKHVEKMLAELRIWGYVNEEQDKAAVKATGKHLPDAYGYLQQIHAGVNRLSTTGLTAAQAQAAAQAGAQIALNALAERLKD